MPKLWLSAFLFDAVAWVMGKASIVKSPAPSIADSLLLGSSLTKSNSGKSVSSSRPVVDINRNVKVKK